MLAVGAVCGAVAGLLYGVEEFVFLAFSVGVLLVLGTASVWYRQHVTRRDLRLVVQIPHAEVWARQPASVELTVANEGRRRLPPILVEDPRHHWSVSHPGLGDSAAAHAARTPASRGFTSLGERSPSDRWQGGPGPRPSRRERARNRRTVAGAQKLPVLAAGAQAALSVGVPTEARGVLTLSDLGLWCEDPFGLVARRITVAPPAHVIVYPVPADVARHPASPHPGGRERPPTSESTNGLSGDELSGLRPYAPGDRLTRLHWPSLARTGELVVREFLEPRAGSLALLVDLRPSAHSGDTFETTVSRAAGFGLAALDQGLTVELCTSAGDRVVIAPNGAGRQTMLRSLALLGTTGAPPAVMRRWGSRPTGGAVWATGSALDDVVLVTTPSGAADGSLPAAIRRQAETILVS